MNHVRTNAVVLFVFYTGEMAAMIRSQVSNKQYQYQYRGKMAREKFSKEKGQGWNTKQNLRNNLFSMGEVPVGSVVEKGAVILFCTVEGQGP